MQVFRTTCTTDCKGRPHHILVLVADIKESPVGRGPGDRAVQAMDKDVATWMADDISSDEIAQMEKPDYKRTPQIVSDLLRSMSYADIAVKWKENKRRSRWEMDAPRGTPRRFVEKHRSGLTTIVYHFVATPDDLVG